jgi:hypothetical protein
LDDTTITFILHRSFFEDTSHFPLKSKKLNLVEDSIKKVDDGLLALNSGGNTAYIVPLSELKTLSEYSLWNVHMDVKKCSQSFNFIVEKIQW